MNIREVFETYGIATAPADHEHSRRGWLNADCPYCSKGWHHWRLGFNETGKYFSCWSCGPKRTVDTFIELTGLTYREVKKVLDELEIGIPTAADEKPTIKRGSVKMPRNLGPLQRPHINYLLGRNINATRVERLWSVQGIGVSLSEPHLQWRLFIPVIFANEVISYTTRSIKEDHAKRYRACPEEHEKFPIKSVLYGEDNARETIIIVEGPIDAWKIGPGAVATLGTSYSQVQLLRMIQYHVRYICFDAEPDGQRRAQVLMDSLDGFPGKTRNIVLRAKDAASANMREVRKLRSLLALLVIFVFSWFVIH